MEKKGLDRLALGPHRNGGAGARVYSLTADGKTRLAEERENWHAFDGVMKRIVRGTR